MRVEGLLVVQDGPPGFDRAGDAFALQQVANRPIIHHVLDALGSAGVEDVVVGSSAALATVVRECLVTEWAAGAFRLKFVESPRPLDLPGAMRLAAPLIGDAPCIVHLASGLLGEPLTALLDRLRLDRPDVMLCLHQGPAPDCRLSGPARDMLRIAELHPAIASFGIAGVWLFGQGALQYVAATDWERGGELDLPTVTGPITRAGGRLQVRLANAWCRYAGNASELLELNTLTLDRLSASGHQPDTSGNRIEGRVQIDQRACVRTSIILGPAVIGPDARISDAYIGPYTSIGADVNIESAEIERSIVCPGASITHVGGRIVGSVIGPGARIFRDFSLPRALRLRIGAGTEVALC